MTGGTARGAPEGVALLAPPPAARPRALTSVTAVVVREDVAPDARVQHLVLVEPQADVARILVGEHERRRLGRPVAAHRQPPGVHGDAVRCLEPDVLELEALL
eukprot:5857531-Prymnesium_polylepis.1